jgi:hypothetical protein
MDINLLKPREVDLLFRYPAGRSLRLAKAGLMPCIQLPDGEVRFDEADIEKLLKKSKDDRVKEITRCTV